MKTVIAIFIASLFLTVYFTVKTLTIDKELVRNLTLAGSTVTISADSGILSMEGSLIKAKERFSHRQGRNAALWRTDLYEASKLVYLLDQAIVRSREIGSLEKATRTGILPQDASEWVAIAYNGCTANTFADQAIERLLSTELASIYAVNYELFNDAISGAVSVSGDKVSSSNMALVDLIGKAVRYSFWKPGLGFRDMRDVHARVYFALLYANIGSIDLAISNLENASLILSEYRPQKNITIFRRNVPGMTVGHLQQAIASAKVELESLQAVPANIKYTSGWFSLLQKKMESLGANDAYLGDIAKRYASKSRNAAFTFGFITLLCFLLLLGVFKS